MDLGLKDKVVVVSGGAGRRGSIGEAIVRAAADAGAIPVLIDLSDRGDIYARELRGSGGDALFVKADLRDPDRVEAAVRQIEGRYGRIDVVINNVGANDGVGLSGTLDEFMDSLRLNLVSFWLLVKHCYPLLQASRGNVLNIGSKVALTGQGATNAYAAAKGGVLALTRDWAIDFLPHGMRANAIVISECWTPSYQTWLDTLPDGDRQLERIKGKIPLGNRMTTPREIADTAMFLISERSSHTTGQQIVVDGGYVHLDRSLLSTPGHE